MYTRVRTWFSGLRSWHKVLFAVLIIVLGVALFRVLAGPKQVYSFVTVTRGPIVQSVSLTGNTTPIKAVALAFGQSGTIAHVNADVGEHVYAGQVLATLNIASLAAQLRQAQATVDSQQAKLNGLLAGSRPEDIDASQAQVDKAKQDLANFYSSISDASIDANAKGIDATRVQLNALFKNPESDSPQLTFASSNSQSTNNAISDRVTVTAELNTWSTELNAIHATSPQDQLQYLLTASLRHLFAIRALLVDMSVALEGAINIDSATLSAYKAALTVGQNEVNASIKNLNAIGQSISSQKLLVAQLQAQLDLKKAGATPQDIDSAQALVAQATANVQSVQAQITNAEIIAPIAGIVTQFDAKVGQVASPSVPLISVMSEGGFEVDVGVSETDIGKIEKGDVVSMTIDAFPNETFMGKVFYIAPAQTISQGVVEYLVKISFDKADARIKSGLTVNITIQTQQKDAVLRLPQYAILQNDAGAFVEVLQKGTPVKRPVTLGIQDNEGNVEIMSGVQEGQQVLNIGLKNK